MTLAPGTRLGPYEIASALGEGGMGVVYRATDTTLKRQVALKVLPASVADDPGRLARFQREAELLASLNHPHIAQIHGLEGGALVMELVEGPTLAERIAQGPITLEDALPIARQIAEALDAAHEQGIVHRDLKPANIKVRPDGTVKVLDFGLAKTVEAAVAGVAGGTSPSLSPTITSPAMPFDWRSGYPEPPRGVTQAGMLLGTAPYMSPEQARGKPVDKRADIWAFGCVLFEMVTGRRAFGGENVTDTITATMRDQPDSSLAPPQVRQLLARCLEKDLAAGSRDIGDVWALLDDPGDLRRGAESAPPRWARALPWGLAGAAAIVAMTMATVHFTETRSVPRPLRFHLQIPEEAGSTIPTISPDGTRVAYRLGGQIWVRDLANPEPRAIAPTDRSVGRIFWSADSRFVVYAAGGRLMRAPVAGGPPQTIRDQPLVLAAGIGLPDGGMIVSSAASLATGGGETVRIDGGGARTLAGITGLPVDHGVSLLPDGNRLVFPVFEPELRRGVYIASLDGATPPERLLPDVSDVAYVPSVNRRGEGFLLLLRQGTLVALPVDAARLQARGEPIELATGVGSFTASASDYRS